MNTGFPTKERPFKLALELLKRAGRNVREAHERSDVKPDTDLADMFRVVEEYLDGIPVLIKAREKLGDLDG